MVVIKAEESAEIERCLHQHSTMNQKAPALQVLRILGDAVDIHISILMQLLVLILQ